LQQVQVVEQRFAELRQAAEMCLRDIDQQHASLQQSDEQRAVAWEQVAASLRAMARECTVPDSLQTTVAKQAELRSEPAITRFSLFFCLLIAIGTSGGVIWYAQLPILNSKPAAPADTQTLSVNSVAKQLGCAPGAILPWNMLPVEATAATPPEKPAASTGKTLQHKLRFASECVLGAAIALSLIVALTHGQFGDWLATNPLTAWGRLWGN
jgi:hypothetical protein